jgi:hypothetical protein
MAGKHYVVIDVPAPEFPPVKKRATGKYKDVNPWLNANDHSTHRMQLRKIAKAWREAGAEAARTAAEKHGPLKTPVRIKASVWKPRGGEYDPGNLYPTAKPVVDGFVDAGLLDGDDYTRVIGPDMRHGGKGRPRLVLMIEVRS